MTTLTADDTTIEDSVVIEVDAKRSLVGAVGSSNVKATEVGGNKVFYTVANWQDQSKHSTETRSRNVASKQPTTSKQQQQQDVLTSYRSLGHSRMPVTRRVDSGMCKYARDPLQDPKANEELQTVNEELQAPDLLECLLINKGAFMASCGSSHATRCDHQSIFISFSFLFTFNYIHGYPAEGEKTQQDDKFARN